MCLFVPVKPKRKSSNRSKKSSAHSTLNDNVPAARPAEYPTYQPHTVRVPVPVSFGGRVPECYWDDARPEYATINDVLWQSSSRFVPPTRKPKPVDILTDKIEKHQEITMRNGEDLQKGFKIISERLGTMEDSLKGTIKGTDDNVKLALDETLKGTDAVVQAVNATRQLENDRRAAKHAHRQQRQQEIKVEEAQKEITRLQETLKQEQARDALLELDELKKEVETLKRPASSNTSEEPLTNVLHRLEGLVTEIQRQTPRLDRLKNEEKCHQQCHRRHSTDWRDPGHRPQGDLGSSYHYHYHGADDEGSDWYKRAPPFFDPYPPRRTYRYGTRHER